MHESGQERDFPNTSSWRHHKIYTVEARLEPKRLVATTHPSTGEAMGLDLRLNELVLAAGNGLFVNVWPQ